MTSKKKIMATRKYDPATNTGGGGFNFEAHAIAHFALSLLLNGTIPGFNDFKLEAIQPQGRGKAPAHTFPNTDDFILIGSRNDSTAKIYASIKSDGHSSFKEVISGMYRDYNDERFLRGTDGFLFIVDRFDCHSKDYLGTIDAVWSLSDTEKFANKPEMNDRINVFKKVKEILAEIEGRDIDDESCTAFLKKVNFLQLDFRKANERTIIGETLTSDLDAIAKHQSISFREAGIIMSRLFDRASECDKKATLINRETLLDDLTEWKTVDEAPNTLPLSESAQKLALLGLLDTDYPGDLEAVQEIIGDEK